MVGNVAISSGRFAMGLVEVAIVAVHVANSQSRFAMDHGTVAIYGGRHVP